MIIYGNIRKWQNIKKKWFQPQTIIACWYIIGDTIFDNYFHPVVLYVNYLICILMNINDYLKTQTEGKIFGKMITPGVFRPTLHP